MREVSLNVVNSGGEQLVLHFMFLICGYETFSLEFLSTVGTMSLKRSAMHFKKKFNKRNGNTPLIKSNETKNVCKKLNLKRSVCYNENKFFCLHNKIF